MPKNELEQFYSSEAKTYEKRRYGSRYGMLFRSVHRRLVSEILRTVRNVDVALDVASGTGHMLPPLAACASHVVASDLTRGMLAESKANENFRSNASFCLADASRLPFPDRAFGIVASSRFLHLFDKVGQGSMVAEMARLVANDGVLLVDFYNASPRRVFAPAIYIYRFLLRKRPEGDVLVSVNEARTMVESAGLRVEAVIGVGNYLASMLTWLPASLIENVVMRAGRSFPSLSEQFIVVARRP